MERRSFVQGVAAALAAAVAPATSGCATVGGPNLATLAEVEPRTVGAWLHARTELIRERAFASHVNEYIVRRGGDALLLGQVVSAMWITSTFRDLPARVQREQVVQEWILGEGPNLARAVFGLADFLDGLPTEDIAAVDHALRNEDDLVEVFADALSARAPGVDVEPERVEQVRGVLRQAGWRMKHQSARAVIDELLAKVDRACRRHGFERPDWRALQADELETWGSIPALSDAEQGEALRAVAVVPADWSEPLSTDGGHLGIWVDGDTDGPGAVVNAVTSDSPAHRAGLRAGDRIESVRGVDVTPAELIAVLFSSPAEEPIAIKVRRGPRVLELVASLAVGPGDHIVTAPLPKERKKAQPARYRNATTQSAFSIFGVGLRTMGGGAVVFVLGLALFPLGLLGLAGMAVGSILTIGGLVIIAVGLLIVSIGVVVLSVGSALPDDGPPDGPFSDIESLPDTPRSE